MVHQAQSPADGVLDIVDDHDQVVGQARRGEAYARRLRHRRAFVLVSNAVGKAEVPSGPESRTAAVEGEWPS